MEPFDYTELPYQESTKEESHNKNRFIVEEPIFSEIPLQLSNEHNFTQQNGHTNFWKFDFIPNDSVLLPNFDSDEESPNQVPREGSHFHQRTAWSKIRRFFYKLSFFIGPGWLISMAYLDPGNLEGDIQIGGLRVTPNSGYSLLWLLLVLHIAGWIFQVLALRLGNITGKDLATIIRLEYKRPVSIIIWLFIELAIIGADFQAVIGTAISLRLLFSIPLWLGIIITLLDTFTFLIITIFGIKKLEFLFCVLILIMAVCFWYNFISIEPNVTDVVYGMFIPSIPPGAAASALGLLGCVIMPHNLFLHSALVRSRAINRSVIKHVKEANFFFSLETAFALFLSFLINIAVVASFASPSIEVSKENPLNLYNAHVALQNALGALSVYIWAIGLFAAGQNATMAGTYAGQYIMEGILDLKLSPFIRIMITRCITIVPLFSLIFLGEYTVDAISSGVNILQALILPIAIIPLLKVLFSLKAMGYFVLKKTLKIILTIGTLGVVIANFILMVNTFIDLDLHLGLWILSCILGVIYALCLVYLTLTSVKGSYAVYTH